MKHKILLAGFALAVFGLLLQNLNWSPRAGRQPTATGTIDALELLQTADSSGANTLSSASTNSPQEESPAQTSESLLTPFQKGDWGAQLRRNSALGKALVGSNDRVFMGPFPFLITSELQAQDFVQEFMELRLGASAEIAPSTASESPRKKSFRFQQTHEGVAVIGAFVDLFVDQRTGRPFMLNNSYKPLKLFEDSLNVSLCRAYEIVEKIALPTGSCKKDPQSTKAFIDDSGSGQWAWSLIGTPHGERIRHFYIVGASTGEILFSRPDAFH